MLAAPFLRRYNDMPQAPIDVYSWPTPNGHKVHIMLEECGLPYVAHPVNIGKGDQFAPDFLAISPNNKIPAIVDPDGPGEKRFALFESGAILIYLGEKTQKLIPKDPATRYVALQWLMFQMGGLGPMLGQTHHFLRAAPEPVPYAIKRYKDETRRLYGVLDKRLAETEHLAGEYSIADIASFPWVARHEWHQIELGDFPNVKRWYDAIGVRPAVQRGMKVPA